MSAGRPIRVDAPEIKPGQVITLARAVEIYAERDRRVDDAREDKASHRARTRISAAVANHELQRLDGRMFSLDEFMAWCDVAIGRHPGRPKKAAPNPKPKRRLTAILEGSKSREALAAELVTRELEIKLLRRKLAGYVYTERKRNNILRNARRKKAMLCNK